MQLIKELCVELSDDVCRVLQQRLVLSARLVRLKCRRAFVLFVHDKHALVVHVTRKAVLWLAYKRTVLVPGSSVLAFFVTLSRSCASFSDSASPLATRLCKWCGRT